MITFEEVLEIMQAGYSVELKFGLGGAVFSRHEISLLEQHLECSSNKIALIDLVGVQRPSKHIPWVSQGFAAPRVIDS